MKLSIELKHRKEVYQKKKRGQARVEEYYRNIVCVCVCGETALEVATGGRCITFQFLLWVKGEHLMCGAKNLLVVKFKSLNNKTNSLFTVIQSAMIQMI